MVSFYGILMGIFLSLPIAQGQICDSFDDGELLTDPAWLGDVADFTVNAEKELQLKASASGRSVLFLPIEPAPAMEWEIAVRMDFAPSAQNRLQVFLYAAQPDADASEAYFLEIGEAGNQDAVKLYHRRANGDLTLLAESRPGVVAEQPVEGVLKISFVHQRWTAHFEYPGQSGQFLFNAVDELFKPLEAGYFGISCTYSESRKDRFFFDAICAGPWAPDTNPPELVSHQVQDDASVSLIFDEPVNFPGTTGSGIMLFPGGHQPMEIEIMSRQINLHFDHAFRDGETYRLHIESVSDTSGNVLDSLVVEFTYQHIEKAGKYDLLIHEIMADPLPAIALPDREYIEIFHNGLFAFDLKDYRLRVGERVADLPGMIVHPGSHLILCALPDTALFGIYGLAAGIDNMPVLPNSGTNIEILDDAGQTIHSVTYDRGWYNSTQKDGGGWSLEMVNTEHVCSGKGNWRASENLRGGTPGRQNSAVETFPDVEGPSLVDIFPENPVNITLTFSEDLSAALPNADQFALQPWSGDREIELLSPRQLSINLSKPLESGVLYRLEVGDIRDCLDNPAGKNEADFGLPQTVVPGDLVLNEILFNPGTGGTRFVEVLNCSEKVLRTDDLVIGEISSQVTELLSVQNRKLILPGDQITFTEDREDILGRYKVPNPQHLLFTGLPSWGNEAGNATLLAGSVVIDSFSYSEAWHHPFLKDVNGVSLERVHPFLPSEQKDTWHSAASSAGFATPTGPNSQALVLEAPVKPYAFVSGTFSPDQDGHEDFLLITFANTLTGAVGSIHIFDAAGRMIRTVAQNETIGSNAVYQWDGTDQAGKKQRIGTYIVLIELLTAEGKVQKFTDVCVLARNF